MTEGIKIDKVVQEIVEKAAQEEGTAKPEAPDAGDVSRFENAMNANPDPQAVSGQDAVTQVKEPTKAEAPQNLGDAILEGMGKVKESHDAQVKKVEDLLNESGDKPMSVQDALRLQHELMKLQLQQEVTTKAADKTSQGVQTLFKNQ